MRLDFEHVVDFALDVGEPALGAFHALLGAGGWPRAALESASSEIFAARSVSAITVSAAASASAATRRALLGGFDLVDQRAALLGEQRRRVVELGALGGDFGDAGLDGRDLRGRALLAVLPFVALGEDRLHAAVGEFGLARQRLRFGAHLRGEPAMAVDVGANGGELRLGVEARRQLGQRGGRRSHARPRPRCGRR